VSETFIYEDYIPDISVCDELISYYENQGFKIPGLVGGSDKRVDELVKKCRECGIEEDEAFRKYATQLQGIINNYIAKYPYCNESSPWTVVEQPKIQYYGPNDGYYGWHTERDYRAPQTINRHLVFMTYLNDVTDGGGTEFYHQKVVTEARKGKTIIWPADWMHVHRGVVSPTQDKYIVTGWLSYY
jgi:prolyl 4-hydroxylase